MISYPQLVYVAEDYRKKIVGYVMGIMDEESMECHAHIVSVAVFCTHRKLGLATKLMTLAHNAMEVFGAWYVCLKVRKSKLEAFQLYNQSLGYIIHGIEDKYYADGEDAYDMYKPLRPKSDYQEQPHWCVLVVEWEHEGNLRNTTNRRVGAVSNKKNEAVMQATIANGLTHSTQFQLHPGSTD